MPPSLEEDTMPIPERDCPDYFEFKYSWGVSFHGTIAQQLIFWTIYSINVYWAYTGPGTGDGKNNKTEMMLALWVERDDNYTTA